MRISQRNVTYSVLSVYLLTTDGFASFPRYNLRHVQHRYICLPLLRLTTTEGFPWDDLRKILRTNKRVA